MKDKIFLPNFYGIFEVKSVTKDRIRIEIDKLKNNKDESEKLKENLKSIKVVKNFKIIQSLGSLTIEFDDKQIDSQLMIAIILRLLNLDEEILKERKGKFKKLFTNLAKGADISIYNKTKGLFDIETLIASGFLIYGLKKLKSEMFLPSGATLIWWAYRILSKNKN